MVFSYWWNHFSVLEVSEKYWSVKSVRVKTVYANDIKSIRKTLNDFEPTKKFKVWDKLN